MSKGVVQSGLFYCDHISEKDRAEISQFYVDDEKGKGLENYLKDNAIADENAGVMRTYLVRTVEEDALVGYFSLKAGLISINESEQLGQVVFDTIPGVEIANFAVNSGFIHAHPYLKGVGSVIFDNLIVPIIELAANIIGLMIVYIYALPYDHLIDRYKVYGFSRLDKKYEDDLHSRLKPVYDWGCIFMYQIL